MLAVFQPHQPDLHSAADFPPKTAVRSVVPPLLNIALDEIELVDLGDSRRLIGGKQSRRSRSERPMPVIAPNTD